MNDFISREVALKQLSEAESNGIVPLGHYEQRHSDFEEAKRCIEDVSAADVQPVSTIKKLQEHIKQRILETAFNNGGIYREVAEDIADRIDIWVDEFGRAENG